MNTENKNNTTGTTNSPGIPGKQKEVTFLLCTSGNAVLEIKDELYTFRKGEVAIILHGYYFRVGNKSADYTSRIVTIPATIFNEHCLSIRNIAVTMVCLSRCPVLQLKNKEQEDFLTLAGLCRSFDKQKDNYQEKCLLNIYSSLIYFICGIASANHTAGDIDKQDGKERHYQHFIAFLDLLAEHCCNERNVKFYADKLFITPQYLSTLVKTISGSTALSWINRFVIAEAKQRIKFSGESIQEISYQLNFPDQSFFGKYFKRSTGMSPGSYKYQTALI
ncbi:MAG: helix-turn-helix domain-containing protein [Tannerellaceae bacterium]|nr:helix-turn-helix domain-containing protein [Tannerellaceae bacterium]